MNASEAPRKRTHAEPESSRTLAKKARLGSLPGTQARACEPVYTKEDPRLEIRRLHQCYAQLVQRQDTLDASEAKAFECILLACEGELAVYRLLTYR